MHPICGTTRLLGIVGYPVEHSLSPIMQNAAIADLEMDYVYLPFAVQPQNLAAAIAGFSAIHLRGFNLTIPHKQAILPFLSEVTDIARAVGAVNTVWWTEFGWKGTNTDIGGFLAPLKLCKREWSSITAVVLGNGGAARAVVAGCAQLGMQVWVVGRDRQKLEQFQRSWMYSPLTVKLRVYTWEELPHLLPDAELVVNTTPIGMSPHRTNSPLSRDLLALISPTAIVYDLIYTPRPTQLLQWAEEQGKETIDGLEMLIHQGAIALEIWLQRPVPADVMRQALYNHLNQSF